MQQLVDLAMFLFVSEFTLKSKSQCKIIKKCLEIWKKEEWWAPGSKWYISYMLINFVMSVAYFNSLSVTAVFFSRKNISIELANKQPPVASLDNSSNSEAFMRILVFLCMHGDGAFQRMISVFVF